jgi:hypothetical protein
MFRSQGDHNHEVRKVGNGKAVQTKICGAAVRENDCSYEIYAHHGSRDNRSIASAHLGTGAHLHDHQLGSTIPPIGDAE